MSKKRRRQKRKNSQAQADRSPERNDDVRDKPLNPIAIKREGEKITVAVPPSGISGGCMPVGMGIAFTIVSCILTTLAFVNADQFEWSVPLVVGGFWASAIFLVLYGIRLAITTVTLELNEREFLITRRGLLGRRVTTWPRAELQAVRIVDSGTRMNDYAVPQISIRRTTGETIGITLDHDRDDLLRAAKAIDDAQHKGQPSSIQDLADDFGLSHFRDFRPGELIFMEGRVLERRYYPFLAIVGVIVGGMLALGAGLFLMQIAGEEHVDFWRIIPFGALCGIAALFVLVQGMMPKRSVRLDWFDGVLTYRHGSKVHRTFLSDIDSLVLRPIRSHRTERVSDRERRSVPEYLAKLSAVVVGNEIPILETDNWVDSTEDATAPLRPVAEKIADSLGVGVRDMDMEEWSVLRRMDWTSVETWVWGLAAASVVLAIGEVVWTLIRAQQAQ